MEELGENVGLMYGIYGYTVLLDYLFFEVYGNHILWGDLRKLKLHI